MPALTALLVLIAGPADQATLILQITGAGSDATLNLHVEFPRLPIDQLLYTDITAIAVGRPSILLAQAISRAGASDPTTATFHKWEGRVGLKWNPPRPALVS